MTVSARLSHALHQTLGDEAGGDLVNLMQNMDASRAELRELNDLNFARIESKFEIMSARIDSKFETMSAGLETKMEHRFADLLKWSFVFWVGAGAAIAALAGVLRR